METECHSVRSFFSPVLLSLHFSDVAIHRLHTLRQFWKPRTSSPPIRPFVAHCAKSEKSFLIPCFVLVENLNELVLSRLRPDRLRDLRAAKGNSSRHLFSHKLCPSSRRYRLAMSFESFLNFSHFRQRQRFRSLQITTKRIRQQHLPWRPTFCLENFRRRHQNRNAFCPRDRYIKTV